MTEDMEKNRKVSLPAAVLVIIASFILLLFLGSTFFILFGTDLALILGELLLIVAPLAYMFGKKIDIKSYIRLKASPKFLLIGVASGFLLLFLSIIVSIILISIFGESQAVQESNTLIEETSSSPTGLLAVIIALCLAGICEEFLFRGFFQTAISKRYSPVIGMIVSALAFSLFHFDPQVVYTASAFIIGLVLGFVYYRGGSYVVPAIAHSSYNLIVLASIILASH